MRQGARGRHTGDAPQPVLNKPAQNPTLTQWILLPQAPGGAMELRADVLEEVCLFNNPLWVSLCQFSDVGSLFFVGRTCRTSLLLP